MQTTHKLTLYLIYYLQGHTLKIGGTVETYLTNAPSMILHVLLSTKGNYSNLSYVTDEGRWSRDVSLLGVKDKCYLDLYFH